MFIQARVCRTWSKVSSEKDALAVSEALPFLEFDLARQLMLKLKILGRNAAFSMRSEVDVGSQLIIATATATAVYCEAMPPPRVLVISRTIDVMDEEDNQLVKLQRLIATISARNRQFLIESGEQQAVHTRRKLAKKIKEAQLRKAAAKLESQRRKEQRRKRKNDSKLVHLPLSRSTTEGSVYAAPGTTVTSYKRSLSHGWGEKGKRDPKLPSVPNGVEDIMTTPLASNKQVISGDLVCTQPPLSNLDKSDKMDSDSSDSSSSSSHSESGSSSPSSSSSSSSESEKNLKASQENVMCQKETEVTLMKTLSQGLILSETSQDQI